MLNKIVENNLSNLDQVKELLQDKSAWSSHVGKLGGRRFTVKIAGEGDQKMRMRDLIAQVVKIVEESKDKVSQAEVDKILADLKEIDKLGKDALKESNGCKKALTAVRKFFGNIGFNKKDHYDLLGEVGRNAGAQLPKASSAETPSVPSTKADSKAKKQKAKVEPARKEVAKKYFEITLSGPRLFSSGMSEEDIKSRTKTLISSLKGGVISKADFEKNYTVDKTHYLNAIATVYSADSKFYIQKSGDNIQRLVGKRWVEQVAQVNGCDLIKTPEIKLALDDPKNFVVQKGGTVDFKVAVMPPFPSHAYLERVVERDPRPIQVNEGIQLATVLAKARYSDFNGVNFLVAKDGIYIIDLDAQAFSLSGPPQYNEIYNAVAARIAPEDKSAFDADWNKLKAKLEKEPWPDERVTMSQEHTSFSLDITG